MFDWFFDILGSLGFWNKKARILFLGLDNAGKTTLTRMLVDKKLSSMAPTRHPQGDEIQYKNIRFKTFDMGGHAIARQLWAEYFTNVDAVIYVVDSFDKVRFPESRTELQKLLADSTLIKAPFLVFGNKIDIDGAASEEELREALGLTSVTTGKEGRPANGIRPVEVFMCSVIRRSGYIQGIEWLSQYV